MGNEVVATPEMEWFADLEDSLKDVIILDGNDEYVCEIQREFERSPEQVAQVARLIVAAPKLLAMLERITDWMGENPFVDGEQVSDCSHDEDYGRMCGVEDPNGCLLCEARALILTVKGEGNGE